MVYHAPPRNTQTHAPTMFIMINSWPVVFEISPSAHGMQSKQQTGSPWRIPILVPGWHLSLHTERGTCDTTTKDRMKFHVSSSEKHVSLFTLFLIEIPHAKIRSKPIKSQASLEGHLFISKWWEKHYYIKCQWLSVIWWLQAILCNTIFN